MAPSSARANFRTTGVGRFVDSADMKAGDVEPDRFYFDQALKMIESEQGDQPLFIFVYTVFNHFPWWNTLRPELTPDWRDLGNEPEVDEYIRRQTLSARDYADFKQRLAKDYPGKPFLVLRFGDHQPGMARIIDPAATEEMMSQRMMARSTLLHHLLCDRRDQLPPKDVRRRWTGSEPPVSPLVVQEAAGLPLDPSFVEQTKILPSVATGCFSNVPAAPKSGASTGC